MTKLVIVLLLQIIITCSSAEKKSFTFDDIFDPLYKLKTFQPTWLKNKNEFTYVNSSNDILKCDATKSGNCEIFVPHKDMKNATRRFLSPDEKHFLLGLNSKKLWRHSFFADYEILDIKNTNKISLETNLQYANWGNMGNKISYVKDNDLYVFDVPNKNSTRITKDGSKLIINGVPDWLYEEDVLSSRVAHYWSPKDEYLCFAKFDEKDVKRQYWPMYGNLNKTYESLISVAYPKAGFVDGKIGKNPNVTLHVVKVDDPEKIVELLHPKDVGNDKYFLQVVWKNNATVLVTWVNRRQDKSVNVIYDVSKMASKPLEPQVLWTYEQTNGWVESKPKAPIFLEDDQIITIEPHEISVNGKKQTWRHPVKIDTKKQGRTFLLNTSEEVSELLSYESKNKMLYYITTDGKSGERHISKLQIDEKKPECLTCKLSKCKYSSASFSNSAEYYFLNCHGPDYPSHTLKAVKNNELIKVYEENKILKENMASKLKPSKEYYKVEEKDYTINVELYLPSDKMKDDKFPLLIFTYAGPETQEVSEEFDMGSSTRNWLLHLSSAYKIAIASIDGRGSIGNGEDLKFQIYKKLGVVEVEDQIKGTKFLKKNVKWIDSSKPTAIFGWSYGGQTTLHSLVYDNDTFQCGLSIAGVASQALYDTCYVERYLGLFNEDNGKAYENTDITRKIDAFKGKKLLLAHGMADDNVHYSHFAYLVKELEAKEIKFTQLTYPDEDHSISSPGVSRHLFSSMTDFVKDCFDIEDSRNLGCTVVSSVKVLVSLAIVSAISVLF